MNFKSKKIVFGIILLLSLSGLIYVHIHLAVDREELEIISGTLDGEPQFREGTRGRSYVQINLLEFENLKFKTDDFSHSVLNKELLKSEIGDDSKINILIRNEDNTSWVDDINRSNDWHEIIVLNDESNQYISLSDYNAYRNKDYWWTYSFWLALLLIYVTWVVQKKRTVTNKNCIPSSKKSCM